MSCEPRERLHLYAIRALPASEVDAMEAHLSGCPHCRRDVAALRSLVDSFDSWPIDVLRPSRTLWDRLSERIAGEAREEPTSAELPRWTEPEWDEVAPGISCKLLATDSSNGTVSMLVRLAPGVEYPPHTHAGPEELHLLDGELWIDDRKLYAGDYHHAEAGTSDARVWSETGCTCVLMTSSRDVLH